MKKVMILLSTCIMLTSCTSIEKTTKLVNDFINQEEIAREKSRREAVESKQEAIHIEEKEREKLTLERDVELKKAVQEKKVSIENSAEKIIKSINTRTINTLKLRDLYLGIPAEECAILLNHYLDLPSNSMSVFYEYDSNEQLIYSKSLMLSKALSKKIKNFNKDSASHIKDCWGGWKLMIYTPQTTQNGKLSRLSFPPILVDSFFNVSSLTAEEFAQALVNNYSLIPSLVPTQINTTYPDPIYGWKYIDLKLGFKLFLSDEKILTLESVAGESDIKF